MHEPFKGAQLWFTVLLCIEVMLGLAIMITAFCYERTFSLYWISADRPLMWALLFSSFILGLQITVTYIYTYIMWRKVWLTHFSSNVQRMLQLWMFFCVLIIAVGLGSMWVLYGLVNSVVHTTERSLRQGIDLYYSNPEWKLLWDNLQYRKECCGILGYEDWMKAEWMPPESEQSACKLNSSVILAPYACCQHNCLECFEKYMPHPQSKIPQLELDQINTRGCLQHFIETMWTCVYLQMSLIAIALKIDCCLLTLTKYIMGRQNVCIEITSRCDEEGQPLIYVNCPSSTRQCISEDKDCGAPNCSCGQSEKKKKKRRPPSNADDTSSCHCPSCLQLSALR